MFITQVVPGAWGVAIATGVMTVLVVVFVEVLPKTLAIVRADDVARALSGPMLLVVRLLGPVIYAIQWIVRHTLRLFGVRLDMGADVLAAHEEIRGAVEYHHSEGLVESRDRRDAGRRARPRRADGRRRDGAPAPDRHARRRRHAPPSIVERGAEEPLHAPAALSRRAGEHRRACCTPRTSPAPSPAVDGIDEVDIAAIVSPPWFMPETTHLKDQLNAFLKRRAHFALVVDEYGALQGLVTLEDILEEIVGEIEDEHDEPIIRACSRQADGSVIVDGDVTVRELNRALDWDLPDEHAVTVAGLVIHEAQTIPEVGQTFIFHDHRFQVLRRQRNQITSLRIIPTAARDVIAMDAQVALATASPWPSVTVIEATRFVRGTDTSCLIIPSSPAAASWWSKTK